MILSSDRDLSVARPHCVARDAYDSLQPQHNLLGLQYRFKIERG